MATRVLHVITRLDAGGAATNTLSSVRHLGALGFACDLAYGVTEDPDGRILREVEALGCTRHYLPRLVREVSPWNDVLTLLELRRLLRGYDLVHTHCSKAGTLGRLAARLVGTPVVHTPHGHILYGYFGRFQTWAFTRVEAWMTRLCARVISLTDLETDQALAQGIGRRDQYRTIPSGVPLGSFRDLPEESGREFRRRWNIPATAPLVVAIGRLAPVKCFDVLLDAFGRLPWRELGAHLAIVGRGEEAARLAQRLTDRKLEEAVRLTGHMDDVRPALSAADVFALPSRNEGMGRALAEAMAAGRAVIGTRVGGVPALVEHGRTGLLVPPSDPAALAGALEELLRSPERRRTLGAAAADSVYPEFDESTMIRRLAGLYEEVLTHHA